MPSSLPVTPHLPLDHYDWPLIGRQLDAEGWALLPGFFPPDAVRQLTQTGNTATLEALRPLLYRRLLPIARAWADALQLDASYPDDFPAWLQHNRNAGQTRPLTAIQRLTQDGYQPLAQHADGEAVFPLQLVALLSAPETAFTGGEFVMTEQRPRMQSRPMVLPLRCGDAAIIAVSHRPVQGAQNVYRVTARQAISRVRAGQRVGLELLLHDGR
ncbi:MULTISPECIES: 2OG-Fe(II) oxygenase [Achromobacter]|uniref:2OG-Fe(II) oxygenase n=1 Tax=Achromobacter spanius TaxID=217203 RepID=A0ABY8H1G7_9BURK|nr:MULTISPECIES: 2OG-Fe(II) oxygenase [Achromobacter]WAI85286.1 2OG-Fe(II) oxygenase [Achromobacter spanius]WEX95369.1 2OG-Fe(II) oxygenase [Achromobacter sp. SS2-2022]WFP10911.1 2OG-Fe(II) oxygenase [Achromobacter spanius]